MKCLGIHLAKRVRDPYIENYKALLRKIKENLNTWSNNISCSRIGSLNIVMILIHSLNAISVPRGCGTETDKVSLKFTWKSKGPRVAKIILEQGKGGKKRAKLEDFHLQTYYNASVIKTACFWCKSRHMGQRNRTESRTRSIFWRSHGQLSSKRGIKVIWWAKESLFYKWYQNNLMSMWREVNLDPSFPQHTKLTWGEAHKY